MQTDTAIVGGGLSGLAVTEALLRAGMDARVFEARERLGGRILVTEIAGGWFDLGPAWIWPHNTRMLALVRRFSLQVHEQHAAGNLVFEAENGQIRRDYAFATMGDALRVAGGLSQVPKALLSEIDLNRVHTAHRIERIEICKDGVHLSGVTEKGAFNVTAKRVVLAMPPRLVASRLVISPSPPPEIWKSLSAIPTWMAAHAKFLAVYDDAFWRKAGLSGDAISHRGPLMEVHDATDKLAGAPALFGFLAPRFKDNDARAVQDAALAQLQGLFGAEAANPKETALKDWSRDPDTASAQDADPPSSHPIYGLPSDVSHWADKRVVFAGTEVAPRDGGFLEGALEAAEIAVSRIMPVEKALN